jgi:aminopeptidase N
VSLELARQRAATIRDVRYDLRLSIPETPGARLTGSETIHFQLSDTERPLVLDFEQRKENVRALRVSGIDVAYELVNGHLIVPPAALAVGEVEVEIEFVAGDEPLNRNPDYLYTLFVPDRARFAFPCFDQPDLKARFTLTLELPAAWEAIANAAPVERVPGDGRSVIRFAETAPISTYLFSFAAGEFRAEEARRGGRLLRFYHRETDTASVARNRQAIFDLHATALRWLEEYTGIEYPFDKFEFVLIPSFQYSGMEHPGAILYRASSLLLDPSATQSDHLRRASLIAHETSHMWFGDLVTMRWFDDVWTKEVFANFMAAKIVNPSFPAVDHELRFLLTHFPPAYEVDRTEGTNPIRQPLENLREAGSLYGAIIYQKAPIVMRQLETWLGAEGLQAGLRDYLGRFSYRNATWPELIDLLDARTPDDLGAWSRAWVEEPGRPTIETRLRLDSTGRIAELAFEQTDPGGRGRVWPQMLDVMLGYPPRFRAFPIQMTAAAVRVEDAVGLPAPEFVLPGGRGLSYGLFRPDSTSLAFLLRRTPSLAEPLVRGIAWVTLWEAMLERRVAPAALLDLAVAALLQEGEELLVQHVLERLSELYWRYLPAAERGSRARELETLLRRQLRRADTPTLRAAYFDALRSLATTDDALGWLERVWRGEEKIPGLELAEADFTRIAQTLALRAVPGWREILTEQESRIVNPDRKARFAFVRPALDADPAVRDSFFEGLRRPENREHEPWVLDGLGYLNHPLRAPHSEKYILPGLELLQEIQVTGDIFFPKGWLDALLAGHRSERAASVVRRFLAEHPDYPPRLRGKILQSADPLFRSAAIAATSRP